MKRFVLAVTLACALATTTLAGEIPSTGTPEPGDINNPGASVLGDQGNGGLADDGDQGSGNLAALLSILDLVF